jgi:hypothetical protein
MPGLNHVRQIWTTTTPHALLLIPTYVNVLPGLFNSVKYIHYTY